MTLEDALAAVRDGPCDLGDMMRVEVSEVKTKKGTHEDYV